MTNGNASDIASLKARGWHDGEVSWNPTLIRDVLGRKPSVSCCIGCPNRQMCDKGYACAFHVLECDEPVAKDAAISLCARVLGIPEKRLQSQ